MPWPRQARKQRKKSKKQPSIIWNLMDEGTTPHVRRDSIDLACSLMKDLGLHQKGDNDSFQYYTPRQLDTLIESCKKKISERNRAIGVASLPPIHRSDPADDRTDRHSADNS